MRIAGVERDSYIFDVSIQRKCGRSIESPSSFVSRGDGLGFTVGPAVA